MKSPRWKTGVLLGSSLLLSATSTTAQLLPPPRVHWQEIVTPHFLVHHEAGSDSLAQCLAAIAEATYREYESAFGIVPSGRVQVYLQEAYDVVNSLASAPGHLSIYIFPHPPYGIPYGQIGHYRDWLELAFVHEYMHVVDLERRRKAWKPVHVLTGLGYPNLFRPLWSIEGIAVWAESRITGGGRIGSPTTEMVIRADVLAGHFRDLAEWSGAHQPWPASTLSYLYGGSYLQYLSDTCGELAPVAFRQDTAGRWPWSYEGSLFAAGALPGSALSFHGANQDKARRALAAIEARGPITEGDDLGRTGTAIFDLLSTPLGIVVASSSDQDGPRLLRLRSTGRPLTLRRLGGVDVRLASAPHGILYSDVDIDANTRVVSRVYSIREDQSESRQVSPAANLHEPACSPDGELLVACQREGGRSRIVIVTREGAHPLVTALPADADVFDPTWSPDGTQLAVSVWRDGRQDIWLVDRRGGHARALTDDVHWDIQPTWSRDGKEMAFASDRSGIWNIYAVEPRTGTLRQLTNVTTGAFLPEYSLDGASLYFSRYTPDGDEVRRLALASIPPFDLDAAPTQEYQRYLARTATMSREAQAPTAPSRAATWWREGRFLTPIGALPLPLADERGYGAGLLVFGAHPLSTYSYVASAGVGFDSHRFSYDAAASGNVGRGVALTVHAGDLARPTGASLTTTDEAPWRQDRELSVQLGLPWYEVLHRSMGTLQLRIRDTDAVAPGDRSLAELPAAKFFEGRTVELRAGVAFDNAKAHPLSFSPEDGLRASASVAQRIRSWQSDRTGTVTEVDVRGYRRVAEPVVLAAHAHGVRGTGLEVDFSPWGDMWVWGLERTFGASSAALAEVEVRWRIREIQKKVGWDAIYLHRTHAALFAQGARLQDRAQPRGPFESVGGFGARASIDVTLGYFVPLTLSLVAVVPSHGEATTLISASGGF